MSGGGCAIPDRATYWDWVAVYRPADQPWWKPRGTTRSRYELDHHLLFHDRGVLPHGRRRSSVRLAARSRRADEPASEQLRLLGGGRRRVRRRADALADAE